MSAVINLKQSNIPGFLRRLRERNTLLFDLGAAHLVLLAIMTLIAPFDDRTVTGVNPWIKPMKFAISIAVYAFTMIWILDFAPIRESLKRRINWILASTLAIEIILITMQAARGVTSHFNQSTPFNAIVFAVMGAAITVNIFAAAYVGFKFWTAGADLPAPLLWGIRLGLTIFVFASFEAFLMVRQRAHSVGLADGGAGLPFLNWSTLGGDLRIAHFFGMHSLQALPLIGYWFSTRRGFAESRNATRWVQFLGLAYGAVALFLLFWALAGRPLVALSA